MTFPSARSLPCVLPMFLRRNTVSSPFWCQPLLLSFDSCLLLWIPQVLSSQFCRTQKLDTSECLTLTPCTLSCQPPWIVSGIVSPLPLLLLVLREVTVESQRSADSVPWIWLFNSLAFEVGFLFCYFLLLLNILSGNLSGAYICFLVH